MMQRGHIGQEEERSMLSIHPDSLAGAHHSHPPPGEQNRPAEKHIEHTTATVIQLLKYIPSTK